MSVGLCCLAQLWRGLRKPVTQLGAHRLSALGGWQPCKVWLGAKGGVQRTFWLPYSTIQVSSPAKGTSGKSSALLASPLSTCTFVFKRLDTFCWFVQVNHRKKAAPDVRLTIGFPLPRPCRNPARGRRWA